MTGIDKTFVLDTLPNIGRYVSLGNGFAKAAEFLQRADLFQLPVGRYELDGDSVYAMVQDAQLRPWGTGLPEVHRRYFDIQLPLSEPEVIGIAEMTPAASGSFDEAKDIGFYDHVPVEPVTVQPGEFVILRPRTCAHLPCCTTGSARSIRKIVVKIRADE